MKRETTESLLSALRHVFSGEIYLSSAMQQRVLANYAHGSAEPGTAVDLLSDRELEILHLVGHGIDVKKIAADLNLSPKTVQTYRDRIRQKLAFANARELARFAHDWVDAGQK
jgi:DNA-binding NarL/FixJ family response regulator